MCRYLCCMGIQLIVQGYDHAHLLCVQVYPSVLPIELVLRVLQHLPKQEKAITAKLVNRAARTAFQDYTTVPANSPELPLWALQAHYALQPFGARGLTARAAVGDPAALQWLRVQDPPCAWDSSACSSAACFGCLEVLQWLRSQDPPCSWSSEACNMAAMKGHVEVLQWLAAQNPPWSWNWNKCSSAAAGAGHLQVLQWLHSQDLLCLFDSSTCSIAAVAGHLHVLQWLRSQQPRCPWDWRTCAWAAAHGHLAVLQWARSQHPPCL